MTGCLITRDAPHVRNARAIGVSSRAHRCAEAAVDYSDQQRCECSLARLKTIDCALINQKSGSRKKILSMLPTAVGASLCSRDLTPPTLTVSAWRCGRSHAPNSFQDDAHLLVAIAEALLCASSELRLAEITVHKFCGEGNKQFNHVGHHAVPSVRSATAPIARQSSSQKNSCRR